MESESDARISQHFVSIFILFAIRRYTQLCKLFSPQLQHPERHNPASFLMDPLKSSKKMSVTVGPWGGNGGSSWDDGTHQGIREITLVYDRCIDSIKAVYDQNGKPLEAEKHGGVGGSKTAEIKLEFPGEYLVSVSGHYCPVVYGGSPVIRSLMLKSNRRTFGPFGVEEGTPFMFSVDGGRIVGLTGRSGWYVDSIGFRLSRAPSTKLIKKVQKGFQRLTSTVSKSSPPTAPINA